MFPSYRRYAGARSAVPFASGFRSGAGGSFAAAATVLRSSTSRATSAAGSTSPTLGPDAPAMEPFLFRVESGISTRTRIPAMAGAVSSSKKRPYGGRDLLPPPGGGGGQGWHAGRPEGGKAVVAPPASLVPAA